jgi:hypothetical protein
VFGIRNIHTISVLHDRPWYAGWFWVNGRNTAHLWDKEGRYMRKSYGFTRVIGKGPSRYAQAKKDEQAK